MARDDWSERLEAYLDGELDRAETAAFEAETAADPALQAELAARREFRDRARRALLGETPADLADLARSLGRLAPIRPAPSPGRPGRAGRRRVWAALAIAASLGLILLVPALLRDRPAAEGPSIPITRTGQVVAIRFGEIPGETVVLQTGSYDLTTDTIH